MAHDVLNKSAEAQTKRASALMVGIMLGGVLVADSYVASYVFREYTDAEGRNFYGDTIALIGALLLGTPIVIHALKKAITGRPGGDLLVAAAIVASIATSDYRSAGLVAFLLLLANLIEMRTALGARASIEGLMRLSPKKALLLADGRTVSVDTQSLRPGDVVRVLPGENIPADGVIARGRSSINQASLTGESVPVDRKEGEEVFGGTTNLSGAIDVQVNRIGEDTTLGKVKNLILQAEASRTPVTRIVDKYAGHYLSVVFMIVGMVLFFTHDFNRAVSLLVVACPCTLVLAMPTAMVAALTCAARLGILIKDVGMLQLARELTAFVFDKTGTLTTGQLCVTRISPAPDVDGAELLSLAAAAEQMSNHPVAKAVVAMAHRAKLEPLQPDYFEEVSGKGVMAIVDGRRILVGRKSWLAAEGVDLTPMEDDAEPDGLSLLYVSSNGAVLGWIGLEDRIRVEARITIEQLRTRKVREVAMITGDRWPVARRVAKEVRCSHVQAEAFPADKVDLVRTFRQQGHKVAVVGDGVNDAPALAAGDLSIAMGAAGSDIAINSANIALMNTDLRRLPFLMELSHEANRVVRQNLMVGIIGIVVFMTLAAMGWLTPIWSAVLHNVGILFVIFNSARLVGLGGHLHALPEETNTAVARLERVDTREAILTRP